ncbi:MAG: LiaI-LiaF-like domain-containing protein [Bryobacteraceae bacterium]
MNHRRALFAQAIRGPILLITIGVLFAMHQAGVLHFSRTWPLIIIVIGVLKLIERLAIPQPHSPQVGGPPR